MLPGAVASHALAAWPFRAQPIKFGRNQFCASLILHFLLYPFVLVVLHVYLCHRAACDWLGRARHESWWKHQAAVNFRPVSKVSLRSMSHFALNCLFSTPGNGLLYQLPVGWKARSCGPECLNRQ